MFRDIEWNCTWKNANNSISHKVAHTHLQTASATIKDHQLLTYLKSHVIMMKSLHKDNVETKEKARSIRNEFYNAFITQKKDSIKLFKSIADRQTKLEEKVNHVSTQVNKV